MHDVDAVSVSDAELQLADLDDGSLLAMARTGHQEAYATLFSRYSYAAHRLARHLGQKEDSDDVVSEAFAQVLDLIGRGKGPDRAFRAYLFTTVRHECARRAKARKRVMPTDDMHQIDTPVAFGDGQLDAFERSAIRAAYESLPPRWQTVLWHLDVEGRKPHELGPLLDLSANSVSALVYRARAGLREAYLQQHVKDGQSDDSRTCLEHRAKLSAFVRRTAPARDQERIHTHLESCSDCMAIYLDLQEVNRDVGLIAAPVAIAGGVFGISALAVGTQLAVLVKGFAASIAQPVVAAALASATLVGVSGTMPLPTRQPVTTYAAPPVTTRAPVEVPPASEVPQAAVDVLAAPAAPAAAAAAARPVESPTRRVVAPPTVAPRTDVPKSAPRPPASSIPAAPALPVRMPAPSPVDLSAAVPDLSGLGRAAAALRSVVDEPVVDVPAAESPATVDAAG